MADWIIHLIEQGGYWGIALLMFIENVFPPIPSELIMGAGGIAVARGARVRQWLTVAIGAALLVLPFQANAPLARVGSAAGWGAGQFGPHASRRAAPFTFGRNGAVSRFMGNHPVSRETGQRASKP